jgi:MTH538 TIR-like domain (DUF1863)
MPSRLEYNSNFRRHSPYLRVCCLTYDFTARWFALLAATGTCQHVIARHARLQLNPRGALMAPLHSEWSETLARKAFYSFHYRPDNWRASKVRNIGVIEGNQSVSDNDWESITNGGSKAIERWIADQMYGKSCVIVLIGSQTAGRKWINHEIIKGWTDKKGVFGIHIHNLTDRFGQQSTKGVNPFRSINVGITPMSKIVQVYDPPYTISANVRNYIADNLEDWVEKSILTRNNW